MTPRTAQDYFPLSPLQQGMLFHSLSEPTGGAYIEQLWFVLEGLDRQLFRRAWELVATRYPVLRTAVKKRPSKRGSRVRSAR